MNPQSHEQNQPSRRDIDQGTDSSSVSQQWEIMNGPRELHIPGMLSALGRDGERIANMFERFLIGQDMAFGLFGNKPVTTLAVQALHPHDGIGPFPDQRDWHSWQVRAHLFQSPNFILHETGRSTDVIKDAAGTPECYTELLFINSRAVEEVVRDSWQMFRSTFDDAESAVASILAAPNLDAAVHGREMLKGILFGFGVENSATYERLNDLNKGADRLPSPGFLTVNEEQRYLAQILQTVPGGVGTLPFKFRAVRGSAETLRLRAHYADVETNVSAMHERGLLAETALSYWMSSQIS